MDDENKESIKILGRNITEIPCFRDSYFYGICTGIFGGFACFMFTSRIAFSTHFSMGTFAVATLSYWAYCRTKYSRELKEAALLKEYMKEQILREGVEKGNEPVTV